MLAMQSPEGFRNDTHFLEDTPMLALLVTCIVVLVVAAFAIWLLSFVTFDAKIIALIRGLIIFFAVVFVILQLYQHRSVFGIHG